MTSRAPVAPVGCPIAVEPPLTFVFALIAAARSRSPPALTRRAPRRHQHHRRGAGVEARGIAGRPRGAAVDRRELRQLLQRRVRARRLVLAEDERLSSPRGPLDRAPPAAALAR